MVVCEIGSTRRAGGPDSARLVCRAASWPVEAPTTRAGACPMVVKVGFGLCDECEWVGVVYIIVFRWCACFSPATVIWQTDSDWFEEGYEQGCICGGTRADDDVSSFGFCFACLPCLRRS